MRIVSYILMQMAPGKAKDAAKTISKIPGVKMAHAVTGPFDVIALADVPDLEALSTLYYREYKKFRGLRRLRPRSQWLRASFQMQLGRKVQGSFNHLGTPRDGESRKTAQSS